VAGRRDEVLLCTKVGLDRAPDGTFLGVRGDREFVRRGCEGSLRRLGTDHVDILFKHWVRPDEDVEEAVGARGTRHRGQGAACRPLRVAPETIRRAHAVHPITAL
jgi:aryl-alcohol dehydrogenase-like predicted oxidoreductase